MLPVAEDVENTKGAPPVSMTPVGRQIKERIMGENTRTALIGIIVEDAGSVEELNQLLHQYRDYIIGRMGIPHPQKSISIISIAMEADQDTECTF